MSRQTLNQSNGTKLVQRFNKGASSALNVRFVDKHRSKIEGYHFSRSRAGQVAIFDQVLRISTLFLLGAAPTPIHLPYKAHRGRFNIPHLGGWALNPAPSIKWALRIYESTVVGTSQPPHVVAILVFCNLLFNAREMIENMRIMSRFLAQGLLMDILRIQ